MEMMNENGYFKAVEDEYIKSLPAGSFSGTDIVWLIIPEYWMRFGMP